MLSEAYECGVNQKLVQYQQQSDLTLEVMREAAKGIFNDTSGFMIGVNGSLARREYTSGSDVDLFFLVLGDDVTAAKTAQETFRQKLQAQGIKMPASGGVFDDPLPAQRMLSTIGGNSDSNMLITRRMLFLLEGEWVFNRLAFEEMRRDLICRYVEEGLNENKICLFLLNDIIRYWRTICVDYEYNIADAGKAKAVRLIKLRFSRMLLYFAGVAAVWKTHGINYQEKRKILDDLLSVPPLGRLQSVFGDKIKNSLHLYTEFLIALDSPDTRKQLESLDDNLSIKVYEELSEKARAFKDGLFELLVDEWGIRHPVVKALLL